MKFNGGGKNQLSETKLLTSPSKKDIFSKSCNIKSCFCCTFFFSDSIYRETNGKFLIKNIDVGM